MPPRAQDGLRSLRDQLLLRQAPSIVSDTSALVPAPRVDLNQVWTDDRANAAGVAAAEAVTNSGIQAHHEATNLGDCRALGTLVAHLRPDAILEIGTHVGASTIAMASALQHTGTDAKLTTIDVVDVNAADGPWRRLDLPGPPRELLHALGIDSVTFVTDRSMDHLRADDRRYGFVFLDGSHVASTVYAEISAALSHLKPDGWIVLHDYHPGSRPLYPGEPRIPGPALAVARLIREQTPIVALPFGELPWPTKADGKLTSLAALGRTA